LTATEMLTSFSHGSWKRFLNSAPPHMRWARFVLKC